MSATFGPTARAAGTVDEIPSSWLFTEERLSQIAAQIAIG